MASHFITRVTAIRDAVDRLEWEVRVSTDFGPYPAFIVHWEGDVVFYQQPVPSTHGMGSSVGLRKLPARWTNRENTARIVRPGGEAKLEFVTELPGDAFDRIDAFRDGGRLFARLEGKVFVVGRNPGHREQPAMPWLDDIVDIMGRGNRPWTDSVRTEPFDLRDVWCTEVLATLRPPGKVILEVNLPRTDASEEHGRRALGHLSGAQRALDEGHYDEVARLVYQAGEALQQLGRVVEVRYGELAQKSIAKQNSALQALCHPERHDDSNVVGGHDTDRAMALHLVASMKSLAAIYLSGPATRGGP